MSTHISCFFFSLLLTFFLSRSLQIDSSIEASDILKQHVIDISSFQNSSVVSVVFTFSNKNRYSATFVLANFEKFYSESVVNIEQFYNKKPQDYKEIMDLSSMQLGKTQYINLIKNENQTMLYLTVFNLDPSSNQNGIILGNERLPNIPYKISITQNIRSNCFSCQNGGIQKLQSQFCSCQKCNSGFEGYQCSIHTIKMRENQKINGFYYGSSLRFFQIPQLQKNAVITVRLSNGVGQMFIQSISFQGEFASYTNKNSNLKNGGALIVQESQQYLQFTIPKCSTKTSITFINYLATNYNIQISFSTQSYFSSSIVIIVVSVVCSVFAFVVIVIGICYLLKNPTKDHLLHLQQVRNFMSDQDIEKYFPTIVLNEVWAKQIDYNKQLKEQIQNNSVQCVICLNLLQMTEKLKVTYCKHIFHENCLLSWFEKQKNCPCCRLEFVSKSKVKQQYDLVCSKLVEIKNPNKIEMVRQILKHQEVKEQSKTVQFQVKTLKINQQESNLTTEQQLTKNIAHQITQIILVVEQQLD